MNKNTCKPCGCTHTHTHTDNSTKRKEVMSYGIA